MDDILRIASGASAGAANTDVATNGFIGHSAGQSSAGYYGWVRWSNIARGAVMTARGNPPDPTDANTIGQWNTNEGSGATLIDSSGEGNNGAITGVYSWKFV